MFSRQGATRFVSYITGPSHIRLGLTLAEHSDVEPILRALPAIGGCEHGSLDEGRIRDAVLEGVGAANAQNGSSFRVAEIVYVSNDSPRYDLFQYCATLIIDRTASGGAFDGANEYRPG